MEQYWDCGLCRIENKGEAHRCRSCYGKLRGRDRLLFEIGRGGALRRRAVVLSSFAAGLGQIYQRRWATGLVLATLIPLAVGLVWATWSGFTYGHVFLAGAAVFVLALSVLDVRIGPSELAAPCQRTCPAGIEIPDYLQLTLNEEYEQGYSLVRSRIPLVGVIGRVCPHPCESQCLRGVDGEPIAINGCKRFLADRHREAVRESSAGGAPRTVHLEGGGVSVGVIGSGPAGIACAYYLSVLGASVTVYEADSLPGGRLATTIPDFRLPPYILDEELEDIRDRGVVFRVGAPVGPGGTPVSELQRRHRALFLAVGASRSLDLEIPGSATTADFQAVLRGAKLGPPPVIGKRVAVVGGGNAAMDVCRTAFRLGAEEVHLLYRRSRDEMPAREDEVEEASREGVQFHFLSDPAEIRAREGGGRELVVNRTRLEAPDGTGRPRPVVIPGQQWTLEVDTVIPALGQLVSGGIFEDPALGDLRRTPEGTVWADRESQRTSIAGIYAGGDAVSGPGTAVQAMAEGRRAALAIFSDLQGQDVPSFRLTDRRIREPVEPHRETPQAKIREEMPRLSLRVRKGGFREVEEGFRQASACREAGRCLQCHRDL